jgi:hypothetical protein
MHCIQSLLLIRMNFAGLGFARRSQESGIRVHLLDIQHRRGKFRRHSSAIEPAGEVITWDQIGTPEGITLIQHYVRKIGAEAIVTMDELCLLWLARHRDAFEPQCTVMAPPAAVLERFLSKRNQVDVAREAGFNLLPTWLFESLNDVPQVPPEEYPICLRPSYPNSTYPKLKAKVIRSSEELRSFLGSFSSITSPLIGQPFHPGPNLVVHGARSCEGILEMRGFLAYRKFGGLSLCVENTTMPAELAAGCRNFAELSGIVGAFHYDLLRSDRDGRTYFLEINIRMGGSTPKVMYLGHDEHTLALKGFGLASPHVPEPLQTSVSVASKRMLLQSVWHRLTHRPLELDYPLNNGTAELARILREFAITKDPFLSARDLRGTLWYCSRRGESY